MEKLFENADETMKELQYGEVLSCFKKASMDRTYNDEKMIIEAIKATNYFQNNIDAKINIDEFLLNCIKYLTLESHSQGTVIYAEPEISQKLYIILKGEVKKYERKPIEQIEDEYQKMTGEILTNPNNQVANMPKQKNISSLIKRLPTYIFSESKLIKTKEILKRKIESEKKDHNKRQNSPKENKKIVFSNTEQDNKTKEDEEQVNIKKIVRVITTKSPTIKRKKGSSISDEELINKVCKDDPNLIGKYYVGGILKYKLIKIQGIGSVFGEHFMKQNPKNKSICIVAEDVELLALTRDDYYLVIQELMQRMEEKIIFFKKAFMLFTEDYVIKLAYYFTEKLFKKNDTVYKQKDHTDSIYIIGKGSVQICYLIDNSNLVSGKTPSKNIKASYNIGKIPKKTIQTIKIANFTDGQIFGEELLLKESHRLFTAIVTSYDTLIFELNGSTYHKIKTMFDDIFKEWTNQAKSKFHWRKTRLLELLSNQIVIINENKKKSQSIPYLNLPKPNIDDGINNTNGALSARNNGGGSNGSISNEVRMMIPSSNHSISLYQQTNPQSEDNRIIEKDNETEKFNIEKVIGKYKAIFGHANYQAQIKAQEEFAKKYKNEISNRKFDSNNVIEKKEPVDDNLASFLNTHMKSSSFKSENNGLISPRNELILPTIQSPKLSTLTDHNSSSKHIEYKTKSKNLPRIKPLSMNEKVLACHLDKISQLRRMVRRIEVNQTSMNSKFMTQRNTMSSIDTEIVPTELSKEYSPVSIKKMGIAFNSSKSKSNKIIKLDTEQEPYQLKINEKNDYAL